MNHEELLKIGWIIGGTVSGLLMGYGIMFLLKRKFDRRNENNALHAIKRLSNPFIGLAILLVIFALQKLIVFEDFLPVQTSVIFPILLNVVITWLIINAIKIIRFMILGKYDLQSKDNLKARKIQTQLVVFERILITIVVVISFSLILMSFESIRKFGVSLLASAGVAGIIIGLAAQKSIGMILAGFQIAITQPIRLEDVVIVEGEWGWIEEITLTYVVVRIWDKRRLIVPVNYFIEKPFQNWTRTSAEIMGTVFIYVDYGFPVDALREELTRLLRNNDLWDGKVNVLQVTNATDKTMELRALVSTSDSSIGWDLRVFLREKLIDFVRREYPQFLPQTRVSLPEDKLRSNELL
ncbi:MAG: mechanosensitive ion channel domain-containing protein [Prolixibacteraceae bacterium]